MRATKSICIICEKPYKVGADRRAICPACLAKEMSWPDAERAARKGREQYNG